MIETVKNMGIFISSLTLQIHYFKTKSIFAQTSKVYLYAEKIFYPNNMRGDWLDASNWFLKYYN